MTARLNPTPWFTQHEAGGFPVHCATLSGCDLSVMYIGCGWSWLVRRDGKDVAEGLAATIEEARERAEAVCATGRRTADRPCRYGSNCCSPGSFSSV